jgi:hypothetical protein
MYNAEIVSRGFGVANLYACFGRAMLVPGAAKVCLKIEVSPRCVTQRRNTWKAGTARGMTQRHSTAVFKR